MARIPDDLSVVLDDGTTLSDSEARQRIAERNKALRVELVDVQLANLRAEHTDSPREKSHIEWMIEVNRLLDQRLAEVD